jgi:23S rRNA (cytosine1962-C5)-methyltransferase
MNSIKSPVVAADIPSGLDADTGRPLPKAVKATVTVTMGFPKTGFKNKAAKEYIGRLVVADIGLGAVADRPHASGKTVYLRQGKKGRIHPHHPWIYRSQIRKVSPAVKPGETISVIDPAGRTVGQGYYNPASEIAVRLLTFRDEKIDEGLLARRVKEAAGKRRSLPGLSNAWRAVYSEADNLPGLIVDTYADTAVFQILTLGMEKRRKAIVEAIHSSIGPKYIYEKSDSPFRKMEGLGPAKGWYGETGRALIEIYEGKVRFIVDIVNGHKTGFYIDQRRSRMALAAFAKGRTALDLFCYTGGFAVTAAASGASRVRGVDVKEEWLRLGRRNAELNGVSERTVFTAGDAFDTLREIYASGERFDIIVVDPPSFARSKESLRGAEKGYKDINMMAMKTLAEGGILATFSCSHNMPNELFSDILKRAARDTRKKLTILRRCHQAEDHPIVRAIPETEYLKGYFFKTVSA